jgi:hypothetical protein
MSRFDADQRTTLEKQTIITMINLYCRGNHSHSSGLCDSCATLLDYSLERIDHCPWGKNKPTCSQCPIHCYQKDMLGQIRVVMRYAGARMLWHHPYLAVVHLLKSIMPAIRHFQEAED